MLGQRVVNLAEENGSLRLVSSLCLTDSHGANCTNDRSSTKAGENSRSGDLASFPTKHAVAGRELRNPILCPCSRNICMQDFAHVQCLQAPTMVAVTDIIAMMMMIGAGITTAIMTAMRCAIDITIATAIITCRRDCRNTISLRRSRASVTGSRHFAPGLPK